jgi:hypothetical protein
MTVAAAWADTLTAEERGQWTPTLFRLPLPGVVSSAVRNSRPTPGAKYRLRNWLEYNAALLKRGSLQPALLMRQCFALWRDVLSQCPVETGT